MLNFLLPFPSEIHFLFFLLFLFYVFCMSADTHGLFCLEFQANGAFTREVRILCFKITAPIPFFLLPIQLKLSTLVESMGGCSDISFCKIIFTFNFPFLSPFIFIFFTFALGLYYSKPQLLYLGSERELIIDLYKDRST